MKTADGMEIRDGFSIFILTKSLLMFDYQVMGATARIQGDNLMVRDSPHPVPLDSVYSTKSAAWYAATEKLIEELQLISRQGQEKLVQLIAKAEASE